jgi:cytochrome c553
MNRSQLSVSAFLLAALLVAAGPALAEPDNIEICASCHGDDGMGTGYDNVPILAGIPAPHLEEALYAYKDGVRRCIEEMLMCEVIAEMTGDEIAAFAEYYGAMQRLPSSDDFDTVLALNGGQIHEEHCAQCHVFPDDEDAASALGIPLHAQRSDYLRVAFAGYKNGSRDSLLPAMAENLALLDDDDIEALIHYYVSYLR